LNPYISDMESEMDIKRIPKHESILEEISCTLSLLHILDCPEIHVCKLKPSSRSYSVLFC